MFGGFLFLEEKKKLQIHHKDIYLAFLTKEPVKKKIK